MVLMLEFLNDDGEHDMDALEAHTPAGALALQDICIEVNERHSPMLASVRIVD